MAKPQLKLQPIEAQREWLCRWVFTITGQRPSLRGLSDRDVALLYEACAEFNSAAQAKQH